MDSPVPIPEKLVDWLVTIYPDTLKDATAENLAVLQGRQEVIRKLKAELAHQIRRAAEKRVGGVPIY